LPHAVFEQARQCGLIGSKPEGALDSTGLEARRVSVYFLDRKGKHARKTKRRSWPKLTLVCHTQTHLIAGAVVVRGPRNDSPDFAPALRQACKNLRLHRLLADKAYDSEANHRLARKRLGIRSTIIPINPRRTGRRWPTTKYRRQMKRRFPKRVYGQRWQVESAISRHKRLLDSALRARGHQAQKRECLLRVLTHNLMILKRAA